MDDEIPSDARICHDCRRPAPPVATDFTLVSARYGWRLSRGIRAPAASADEVGRGASSPEVFIEWRCPACWTRNRPRRLAAG
jgi:hypothetical protein